MRARRLPIASWATLAWVLLGSPVTAQAYEDRATLGLELGAAAVALPGSELPPIGALVGVEGSIGLDDVWSLRAHADYALHPGPSTLHLALLGVELLYLVDIVQIVPYFGAGIDVLATAFQGDVGAEAGVHAVVGAEYLLSRGLLIGVDVRCHYLPASILEEGRADPIYLTVDGHLSALFDL